MPVTAGSISIARRINTGDYSHKEAKIELHYTAEGDEDIKVLGAKAAHAALVHIAQVLATVVKIDHTPEIHVDVPEGEPKPGEAADLVAPHTLNDVVEAGKRRRRTKAEMQAAPAAGNLAGDADPTTLFAGPEAVGVPADPMMPPLLAAMEGPSTKTAMDGAAEITDKELNNGCNATMLRIKNKTKIQAVIGEYTQGIVSTIPQSARAAFMQKLQALQP